MISTITAEELARKLGGYRSGRGWIARCPAHDDHSPSLSIRDAANKILVNCRAGCSQTDVIAALKVRGLWSVSDWTQQEKRAYAEQLKRDERDRRVARPFADVVTILSEWALKELSPFDLQRGPFTRLLMNLRTDAGMLAEYREWQARDPAWTRALVAAGRGCRQRLGVLIERFFIREVRHAA